MRAIERRWLQVPILDGAVERCELEIRQRLRARQRDEVLRLRVRVAEREPEAPELLLQLEGCAVDAGSVLVEYLDRLVEIRREPGGCRAAGRSSERAVERASLAAGSDHHEVFIGRVPAVDLAA